MINRDLEQLADPFKGKAVRLVELIAREGIPFRVFETRRSFTRSQELFMQGRTYVQGVVKVTGPIVTNARPGSSPHNWGLAVDCVLVTDPQHAWWAGEALPKGPWDTGHADHIALAWQRYGRCVRACDLIWGGDWNGFKDYPHAEVKQWDTYRPDNWQDVVSRELSAGR
jgi:peptidoglycan L-alanyl-D-glutamate endopeptidase CwlK